MVARILLSVLRLYLLHFQQEWMLSIDIEHQLPNQFTRRWCGGGLHCVCIVCLEKKEVTVKLKHGAICDMGHVGIYMTV